MNLLKLDTISVAGAIGHAAAARLTTILNDDDNAADLWFATDDALQGYVVDDVIYRLAEFVCAQNVTSGETLHHFAFEERINRQSRAFRSQPEAVRWAYDIFVLTTLKAWKQLSSYQERAEWEEKRRTQPKPKPIPIEETIFEEIDGLDAKVEWADEMEALQEQQFAAMKQELAARQAEENEHAQAHAKTEKMATPALHEVHGARSRFGVRDNDAKKEGTPAREKPLSAGQTVTKPQANKGGRPRSRPPRKARK